MLAFLLRLESIQSHSLPVHSVQETSPNFLQRRRPVHVTPHNADGLSGRGLMTSSGLAQVIYYIKSAAELRNVGDAAYAMSRAAAVA